MANTWYWYKHGIMNLMNGCTKTTGALKIPCVYVALMKCSFKACQGHKCWSDVCSHSIPAADCYAVGGKSFSLRVLSKCSTSTCYVELAFCTDLCWKCVTGCSTAAVIYSRYNTGAARKLIGYMLFGDTTPGTKYTANKGVFKIDLPAASCNAVLRIDYNG